MGGRNSREPRFSDIERPARLRGGTPRRPIPVPTPSSLIGRDRRNQRRTLEAKARIATAIRATARGTAPSAELTAEKVQKPLPLLPPPPCVTLKERAELQSLEFPAISSARSLQCHG